MYFASYELTDIATTLDVNIDTLRFFVFGIDGTGKDKTCLFQIKKGMSSTAITVYLRDKVKLLSKICGTGAAIISKCLDDLHVEVTNGKVLELAELKLLSSIVVEMDKIVRLEEGLATETIEFKGLSIAEARQILQDDPFAPKDVEVQVLPWLADE
jgi:hypothetical protein